MHTIITIFLKLIKKNNFDTLNNKIRIEKLNL
jgi:hypothetical protein